MRPRLTPRAAAQKIDRARRMLAEARQELADATSTQRNSPTVVYAGRWKVVADALEKRRTAFLQLPSVRATAVGYKVVGDVETDEPCIVLFVRRKLSIATLNRNGVRPFPRFVRVAGAKVPVDVVQMGKPRRNGSLGSVGALKPLDAATIGALARDISTNQPVLITAMHVTGMKQCFDPPPPLPSISFTVPSRRDAPTAPIVGTLAAGTTFGVDAAKITITDPAAVAPYLPPLRVLGWRPPSNDIGIKVTMFGKMSGFKDGIVKYVSFTIPELCLDRCYLVDITTQKGDSGAAIVDSASILLGFLFGLAPSAYGPYRIFCPASLVMPRLGCTIP